MQQLEGLPGAEASGAEPHGPDHAFDNVRLRAQPSVADLSKRQKPRAEIPVRRTREILGSAPDRARRSIR